MIVNTRKILVSALGPTLALALFFLILPATSLGTVPEPQPVFQAADVEWAPPPPPVIIDGHGTGFIPPPDKPWLTGQWPGGVLVRAPGDPAFDWRNVAGNNYVTPVQDQGACGSCYSFAALANLESREILGGSYPTAVWPGIPPIPNYSENNAKECNWEELNNFVSGIWPWGSCDGGSYEVVANFLSQNGTVWDVDDPYIAADVACNGGLNYQRTLLDWRQINGSSVPSTALLKQYIDAYGPIYTSIEADGVYGFHGGYDGTYTFDWYPGTGTPTAGTNHAVLIVGWSNNLPPTLGNPGVPADGWIVKNSWGDTWGDNGYFYITYGSANVGYNSSFVYDWQDYNPNGGVLLYDEAGGWWGDAVGDSGGGNTTCWALCEYTAPTDIDINRIEFWTNDVTTDVDVYVYDSFDGTDPGTLLSSSLNHSFNEAGYHSVQLAAPVSINSGSEVVGIVKYTNQTYDHPVPFDARDTPYENMRTWVSLDGTSGSWTDLGQSNLNFGDATVRLRYTTQTCSIGNRIWYDINMDGLQDVSEVGISGVTVNLLNGPSAPSSTTTSASGDYMFTNLTPGDYAIEFVLPVGYAFSPQNQGGDDTVDSDANTSTGQTTTTTLVAGENDTTWDSGMFQTGTIIVEKQTDPDGAPDTFTFTGTPNGPILDGQQIVVSNLTPGTYVSQEVLPAGWHLDSIVCDDSNSSGDANSGTITFNLEGGESVTCVCNNIELASIGNWVWDDINNNGFQDVGEPGLAGITVNLWDGGSSPIDSTTTDASGNYYFSDLMPANYNLEFIPPVGYNFGPQDQGGDDAIDSDADTTSGQTALTDLAAGEDDLTWDAGMWTYSVDPIAQSSDETRGGKDEYTPDETVYATGSGFTPNTSVDIYITKNLTWSNGMAIPGSPAKTVMASGTGSFFDQVWTPPLEVGEYDMAFDANQNGIYDDAIGGRIDVVDDPNHPGFVVYRPGGGGPTVGGQVMMTDKTALVSQWIALPLRLMLNAIF